ncbi:MAG: YhfC family glutamic-type intramembrane protease [bacterium]|nr:YhfC family glutamic-type intramembrane protease [bacterium]
MNYCICALIVTVVSFLIFFIWQHSWIKGGRAYLLFWLLLSLPLSAIINLFIKSPIFSQLNIIFNISEETTQWPMWFHLITLIVGALAEEAIKIVPLLFLIRIVSLDKVSIYYLGFLLGVGFGIGEAWYIGYSFAKESPEYNSGLKNLLLLLAGFGGERLFTIFIHGFLTAGVTYGILLKKPIIFFLLMGLFHSLINLPALLYQVQKIPGEITGILTVIIFCFLLFSVFLKIGDRVITKWGKTILQKGDEVLYERKE